MSTLTNAQEETKEYQSRFYILYGVLALASIIIFSRLWYLQIIKGQELRIYSEKNRVKETKIPAPRGLILDREGRILVENLPGFEATISPQYATKLTETANAISPIVDIQAKKIIKEVKLGHRKNGPFRPVKIKSNLEMNTVARISKLRFDHPGLDIQQAILRHYPLQKVGAQLFGYVGEISRNQIQRYNKKKSAKNKFEQGDIIGKNGLEEVWEQQLRGQKGLNFVEVDARGREANTRTNELFDLKPLEETPGNNLVLTLDKDLQIAAYEAMKREDKIGPRIGAAVAIKNNGEILAWVNSPSFDPNKFSKRISTEMWRELINDPNRPLTNKAIQDHFPPGSTYKPIVALAALQEKEITPSKTIFSPGSIRFGNRTYHDHTRHGHGNINVVQAIERSSNIFFYKMGIALGIDTLYKYSKLLGIGDKTGIKLPNEVPGKMPNSEWKLKYKGEPWQPGENLSNAIGQGFVLTTVLQMARAYNTIANEGLVYKPYLVKKVIDHKNKLILEKKPELIKDISNPENEDGYIEKKHFKTVKKGLIAVVNGERGTARWSGRLHKTPSIKMAGKTGTIQVMSFSADQIYEKCNERPFKQRHHGFFVGFAPAENPEITVAVLAEHACAGSSGGAPVARDIIYAYLKKHHPEAFSKPKRKKKVVPPPPQESTQETSE